MKGDSIKKKDKPGKVIRVDPMTWKYFSQHRRPKETTSALIRRLIGLPPRKGTADLPQVYYILPESKIVCQTIEEARGAAILLAVRKGRKKSIEKPIEVRAVNG